ncbi:uncharacterized protein LOC116845538 [Odontomachus brunneus]|uniref:uncharacterized protein LOC116845538 n=1 Tax=Odontomachus brunneus TaxID=486640 RepID=UPI0013F1EA71|nr:uncharacterized protein LOC116845538 [Odontomachus brunneus]
MFVFFARGTFRRQYRQVVLTVPEIMAFKILLLFLIFGVTNLMAYCPTRKCISGYPCDTCHTCYSTPIGTNICESISDDCWDDIQRKLQFHKNLEMIQHQAFDLDNMHFQI